MKDLDGKQDSGLRAAEINDCLSKRCTEELTMLGQWMIRCAKIEKNRRQMLKYIDAIDSDLLRHSTNEAFQLITEKWVRLHVNYH